MQWKKIRIERDLELEKRTGITIESCNIARDEDDEDNVRVSGIAISRSGKPIEEFVTIQFEIYGNEDNYYDADEESWFDFGVRQSFEFEFDDSDNSVGKVKLYPTIE